MLDAFIQFMAPFIEFVGTKLILGLIAPIVPNQRIFLLYLFSSAIFAFFVFYAGNRLDPARQSSFRGFIAFLFPKYIWNNPSAWLDIRYFYFHLLARVIIYSVLVVGAFDLTFQIIAADPKLSDARELTADSNFTDVVISTVFMFVLFAFVDFVGFVIHYLQHKVPLLWEFHKVHHSLEVMHPLSNYREHPIDNIVYAVGTGSAYGIIMGLATILFGYVPGMPLILGIPLLMFMFNFLGYNLRHSHVWLRWPGRYSMLFASPAHHHVHHSCHPDHIDKNFAFIFPCWDVIFQTYCLPETNKDVVFGLSKHSVDEYKSCLGIYCMPFKNASALISKRFKQKVAPKSTTL